MNADLILLIPCIPLIPSKILFFLDGINGMHGIFYGLGATVKG